MFTKMGKLDTGSIASVVATVN